MTDTTDTSIALLPLVQNAAVKVTAATQQSIGVQHNGATVASESTLDFEDAAPITFTVTDEAANGRVKITPALSVDALLPWLVDIDVFPTSVSQTNWNTIGIDAASVYNGYKLSTGAQNAEINWDVLLAAGTWTIELIYYAFSQKGIFTIQFDGVTKGTIDSYSASSQLNQRASITSIVVPTTAKIRLKLLMATKNASSSNYEGAVNHVQLRRTA